MNYIVISPYYPQNFQQFTVELANKGITVLGIGQEPYDQLDQPLKDSLTEYFRVENLENLDEVKRAVAFLFYKHGPIDRIESHNEYWLELDAELREQFNVFGAKPKDLKKTNFKSEIKKIFKQAFGNTSDPISRPSATKPDSVKKSRCRCNKAARTAGNFATADAPMPICSLRICCETSCPFNKIVCPKNSTGK